MRSTGGPLGPAGGAVIGVNQPAGLRCAGFWSPIGPSPVRQEQRTRVSGVKTGPPLTLVLSLNSA